jgi:hypothetical protein
VSALTRVAARPASRERSRPKQKQGLAAFPVGRELVLLSPNGEMAHALNESAAGVWHLCDGEHTLLDMLGELRARYGPENDDESDEKNNDDKVGMLADLTEALFRFHQLGLIDFETRAASALPLTRERCVRFVFGIEDKPYFHWQLAILFESLVGQLATGWDITVVVCNDHQVFSAELARLIDVYGVRAITGENHGHSHAIDFSAHQGGYVALNRVEALKAMAAHVAADDLVCLMDTDLFLYGDLQPELFPAGNAMAASNIINDKLFMSFGSEDQGVDLQKILGALGCDTEIKRGGVTVFMTGATLNNEKVIQDCFRFAQIVFLLGKAAGLPDHNVWLAEMACFAMALTANGIAYELLDAPQFAVPEPQQTSLEAGSFFHYYADTNDGHGGPFLGSEWNKQLFHDRNFLAENLESFRKGARSDIERYFLDLSLETRKRLDAHAS